MKKVLSFAIILMLVCYILTASAEFERGEFYPLLAVVTQKIHWSDDTYIIECEDRNGNLWCFFDNDGPWKKGDLANLLMWNKGESLYLDEVVEVYFAGHIEDFILWYEICN